jgi:CHAT domain-containing protein
LLDDGTADQDLGRAITEVNSNGTAAASRFSFLDHAQPIFNRVAALQLSQDHPGEALGAVDRARARFLLDRWRESSTTALGNPGRPFSASLGWTELSDHIPPDTVVLAYADLDGHLASWLLAPTGVEVSPDRTSFSSVARLVERLRLAIRVGRSTEAIVDLEMLHEILVGPWTGRIPAGTRIIFIPVDALWEVPFAALRNPLSGRFLAQDHAVGIAPSVAVFVAAAERDRLAAARPLGSALIVAYPNGFRQVAWSLPALPGAARESDVVAGIYDGLDALVLSMPEATPGHVIAALGLADVAHFAVHGLYDRRSQSGPSLLLAQDGTGPGNLSSHEILQLHLPRTRLVFLAACNTQPGPLSASEGPLGLAHAFLAAGVPAVVASLWAVDDESTARLSVRFHREIRQGTDPITALRDAQMAELSADPHDWTWAAFEVLGGSFPRAMPPPARQDLQLSGR